MQRKIFILIVAVSVAFGASAIAAADHATVEVDQESGAPATVTVTDTDEEPVSNASLTVELADGDQPAYEGANTYTTDENGTVELPAPEETVDVLVTATVDNETVSTEVRLEAAPELTIDIEQESGHPATVTVTADDEQVENATVDVETVDENATYKGVGEYTTDANGEIELPTPKETVDVTANVEYRGASASATERLEAPPELDVTVAQDRGHPATVTVTADGAVAGNATVSVDVLDENTTYAGANETYTTDENGTARLPEPGVTVNVSVLAELDGGSASIDAKLEAAPELNVELDQDGPGLPTTVAASVDGEPTENVSVVVETADAENASYAGTGTYETDENGTVELPAPDETVDVTLTATYHGAEETIVAALEGVDAIDDELPFGQQLQQFKAALELDDDAHRGHEIATWVTENNPGNAPDHAGPKEADEREGEPAESDDTESERGNSNGNSDEDGGSGNAEEKGGNAEKKGNGNAAKRNR